MNNLYIGLLRLENRAAFFACKGFASDAEGNRRRAVVEASREAHFVAKRRHPHVTRYAERSGSVPGLSASPSQLRAGGTPLPHKQRTLPFEKPPKSGCRGTREAHFVAERRHPHVTRYAERSGSVPGLSASPSQLRAGGTPLPHKQRTLPFEKPPKSGFIR